MSADGFCRCGAVRPTRLLGALAVIGGLGAGPAQAASFATTKNFVPAPSTPSYFANEGVPAEEQGGALPAAPQRHKAERSAARGGNAEPRKEAEPDALRRQAATPPQTAQSAKPGEKTAAAKQAKQPPAPATPPAASREKQKTAGPVAAPPVKTSSRPAAPARPRRLADTRTAAPTRHLAARDGLPRTTGDLGTAALATALIGLGFLRQRRGRPDAAAVPDRAIPDAGRAGVADLNVLLQGLEATIRRKLPRRTPFRLSLLPELWPCHADRQAIAAAVIDLTGAAAANLAAGGSIVVGARNFRVDADHAAQSPDAVPGDYVRLTIRENGRGLSETAFAQVFDPLATARPAIVRAGDMARRLGGFVRVETAEDVGTAIHLYFRPAVAIPPV
ncbi:MAG TPA: hypothetical protein VJ770_10515 [Stellaceae bacterium]|nr:hypothetical protein [Stellaceae bacterium]